MSVLGVLIYIGVGAGIALLAASAKAAHDDPEKLTGFYALCTVAAALVLAWWVGLNWSWIGGGQ